MGIDLRPPAGGWLPVVSEGDCWGTPPLPPTKNTAAAAAVASVLCRVYSRRDSGPVGGLGGLWFPYSLEIPGTRYRVRM